MRSKRSSSHGRASFARAEQRYKDLGGGRRARARAITSIAAAACLAVHAQAADAPGPSLDSFWRDFFARPQQAATEPALERRVALGKELFSDVRLSGGQTRSCASCHRPKRAFADGEMRPFGLDGRTMQRNTPALWNLAWSPLFTWDGRANSLAAQTRAPLEHANEMAGAWSVILARLSADTTIIAAFASAFAGEDPAITPENVLAALVAYERSLVSPLTRFDHWVAGDEEALLPDELAGFRLFVGRAGCVGCHSGWRFTDDRFHDIGLPGDDAGRGAIEGGVPGLRAFKTPGLREVVHTAPYMHDGSLPTLEAVVAHYAGGLRERPGVDSGLVRGLELDAGERAQLIAFLRTLSSETAAAWQRPDR
jgi:cytochrome c peroxidase